MNLSPLEAEDEDSNTTDPMPIRVSTCFDGLEITVDRALINLMEDHMTSREEQSDITQDTAFDRWLHGQLYTTEFNKY